MLDTTYNIQSMTAKLSRYILLDSADQVALSSLPCRLSKADAGRYLVRDGDKPSEMSVVLKGFAFGSRRTGDGTRLIFAIYMRGDFINLETAVAVTADYSIQALTKVDIGSTPYDAVLDLAARHPAIGRAFWCDTLADALIAREWMVSLGRRTARQRVSHFICEMGYRQQEAGLGDGRQLLWPFTQEQIADVVGLTSVHVNRTIQSLRVANLISTGRKVISIIDREALRCVGDFHPEYLCAMVPYHRPIE
jgi:CRP-like cAMP-binding protein